MSVVLIDGHEAEVTDEDRQWLSDFLRMGYERSGWVDGVAAIQRNLYAYHLATAYLAEQNSHWIKNTPVYERARGETAFCVSGAISTFSEPAEETVTMNLHATVIAQKWFARAMLGPRADIGIEGWNDAPNRRRSEVVDAMARLVVDHERALNLLAALGKDMPKVFTEPTRWGRSTPEPGSGGGQ